VLNDKVPFDEVPDPVEQPIDYVYRLLKDLFDYDRLGHEFYSLWGLYCGVKYSLLRQFVSNRLDAVWDEMRVKRNKVLDKKLTFAKTNKIWDNYCWKFDCKQSRINMPNGAYLDVRYSFCEYHKKLGEIFYMRHDNNENVIATSRLIQLLLPESDFSVSRSNHLGATKVSCLRKLGENLTNGYEYPVDIYLKRFKISNPKLYEEIKWMIMEYWQCFPEDFPEDFSYLNLC